MATSTAATTAAPGAAAAKPDVWTYVDAATQQQRGPIPEAIIKRLIRKGLLAPQQFVWTPRLKEWAPLASVEPFAPYCRVWFSYWYYMPDQGGVPVVGAGEGDNAPQKGPLVTKDLIALFLDGEIDGLTLVWTQDMPEWKPIGEVPSLKDFLREANEDQEREAEALEKQERVDMDDQVFEQETAKALVAEDGKEYVFDEETKKWVTPQQKIQDDLEALTEAGEDEGNNKNYKHKAVKARAPPKAPPIPVAAAAPSVAPVVPTKSEEVQPDSVEAELMAVLGDGVMPETSEADAAAAAANQEKKRKKKKKKNEKWQRAKTNTWVYVNGLPLDVTIQEVHDHFSKCGVIQTDLATETPRIKLYQNKDYGGLNGDGSVCYMKEASVELAIQLLDKSQIRPDWTIEVSPAVFQQKGDKFVKHKKQRLDSRAKVKRIEQEKALSWNEGEDGDRSGLRIVVIKHMFTPDEIEDDSYEQELKEEIDAECTKIGEVTKVTLFAKHVDGVVVIKFASSGSAAKCVDIMNGRFFGGRKLVCHFWDGTDYTHRESKQEQAERSEKFDEWLNEGSSSSDDEAEDDDTSEMTKGSHPGRALPGDSPDDQEFHSGRVMPELGDDDDDDEDDSDDDDEMPVVGEGEIHAGRVMPDLDDANDSD